LVYTKKKKKKERKVHASSKRDVFIDHTFARFASVTAEAKLHAVILSAGGTISTFTDIHSKTNYSTSRYRDHHKPLQSGCSACDCKVMRCHPNIMTTVKPKNNNPAK
jgi:hypothetical protein